VWRRQAYQEAITYQPTTEHSYRDNMAMFLLALGVANTRAQRFEAAHVAFDRALHQATSLPPGRLRDSRKANILENVQMLKMAEDLLKVGVRCMENTDALAKDIRAQMRDKSFAWWDSALEETRAAVLAVRATRTSAKAAEAGPGLGPGPKSGGAKTSKARRRRERRRQCKHQPRPQAPALQDGRADAAGGGAAGGVTEPTEDPTPTVPIDQKGEGEVGEKVVECAICCGDLDPDDDEEEPTATLPCAHSFHACCIEMWLATCVRKGGGKTCPYCRAEWPNYVV
jgi:hypothetical protein